MLAHRVAAEDCACRDVAASFADVAGVERESMADQPTEPPAPAQPALGRARCTGIQPFGQEPIMRTHLVVSALIALGAASPAGAATVGVGHGGTMRYATAAGELNELYINLQDGRFTIQDGTVGSRDTLYVRATPPCEHDTTPQPSWSLIDAYCPVGGVTRIAIALRDGDDVLSLGGIGPLDYPAKVDAGVGNDRIRGGSRDDSLFGGPGDDTLDGAGGADLLSGGGGDDVIDAQDGVADRIACGAGLDRVTSDALDRVDASCEIVNGVRRSTSGR
jgi:hypothetical protein